jgi:hypothetical protein
MTMATALCGTVIPAQLVTHDEVFVEPPHPLPDPLLVQQRGRRGRRLSSDAGPSWPLYEVVVGGGRIRYSTDPDDCVVHPEGITRPTDRTVGELEAATSEGPSLCEVAWGADGRGYVTGPLDGADASPVRVLGGFASVPDVAYPLVRLGPGPQVPAPAGEPGHRLAVDWVPLTRSGYLIEGVVGYVWSNDPWRSPLYRWDSADGRRLTLGPGPEGWTLRGTLGLAFHRNCERAGLVDLWEMTRNDSVHYAVDPQESEAQGFRADRVVARIFGDDRPGALPLFSIRRGDGDPLCTTCPAEAGDEAAASPVVLGFVEPAHPPEPAFAVPAVTGPDLVGIEIADETGSSIRARLFSAPFPGSVPVSETPGPKGRLIVGEPDAGETNRVLGYAAAGPLVFGAPLFRLAAASGQDRLSTQPPHDGRERIVEVACYLPTARVL